VSEGEAETMPDLEQAIMALYENEGLTDALTDDAAKILLKWGESEVTRLVQADMDEETYEDKAKAVRRAMKRMNSFIEKRGDYEPDKAQQVMARFTEGVYELGYEVPMAQVEVFLQQQTDMDDTAALQALLALLTPDA
jgi:hypothetical protein